MAMDPGSFVSPHLRADVQGRPTWGNRSTGRAMSTRSLSAVPADPPCYCPMLAVDIQAFNDHRRGDDAQQFLRNAMYSLLTRAFRHAGLEWDGCHHEDRGDGVLVVAPPGTPTTVLIDPLVDHLRAGLRAHNKFSSDLARISLRMSVHAGHVYFDENGVSGYAVTHLFRLLDATELKHVLAESGCDFALVSSETLYEEVLSHGPGLIDPALYAAIDVECKETSTRGWLYLPPVRNPHLNHLSSRGRETRTLAEQEPTPEQEPGESHTRTRARIAASRNGRPIPFPRARIAAAAQQTPSGVPADRHAAQTIAARAALITAMTLQGWFANAAVNRSVPARFRERFDSAQRVQHA